jgi:hypothetical protein
MLKGFTNARLACGCRIGFREGVEGSPVTVVVDEKGPGCPLSLHVRDLPLFDHREALRPSTRQRPPQQELDLSVQAAQFVVCPALNGVENVAIDSQQEGFAFGHRTPIGRSSRC